MAHKHTYKHSSWGLNGTKYWRLFIVEYLQPNKFREKPNVNPIYMVSCFSSLGDASCFHVFPGKDRLSLPAQGKKIIFSGKKISPFLIIQERSYSSSIFLERPSFQDVWKKKIWFSVQCHLVRWYTHFLILKSYTY